MERSYRIQKAAELAGVPAGLLRAWERRYGVLHPRRTGGGYRAYSEADIALLRRLKQLTHEGVPIGEAVRFLPEFRRELKAQLVPSAREEPQGSQVSRWQARALEAAARMDQPAVGAVLDEVLGALPPLAAYQQVMTPLQREVGERWHRGELGVAEEHLVTHEVRARLVSLLQGAAHLARRHVVCACFPDEEHEVGLLGAALRLRHAGFKVTYLGARTPLKQLLSVAQRLKPDVVALSSCTDEGRRVFRATLKSVVRHLPERATVVVGGRAAELHGDASDELGVRRLAEEADWSRALPW